MAVLGFIRLLDSLWQDGLNSQNLNLTLLHWACECKFASGPLTAPDTLSFLPVNVSTYQNNAVSPIMLLQNTLRLWMGIKMGQLVKLTTHIY